MISASLTLPSTAISTTTHDGCGALPAKAGSNRMPSRSSTIEAVRPGTGSLRGTAPRQTPLASTNAATVAAPVMSTLRGVVACVTFGVSSTTTAKGLMASSSTSGTGSGISTSILCCQARLEALWAAAVVGTNTTVATIKMTRFTGKSYHVLDLSPHCS